MKVMDEAYEDETLVEQEPFWEDAGPGIEPEPVVVPPPPRPKIGKAVVLVALMSGLLGGAVGAFAFTRTSKGSVIVERVGATAVGQSNLTGVAAVARDVMPSIVRIDVQEAAGPFGQAGSGTGSGVIFTSDGYILTNNHVVDGATAIQVTLSSGEKLTGRVVGTAAPADDIAVVKVDKTGLHAATLGATSALSVGDLAVAVGSPFGLQGSVTAGVISALHRNIDLGSQEHLTDAVQTDAPINPGNSGGALADARGEVVGINTAILGGTGGSVGVGFAIPIDIARRDAEQIIKTGHAQRPFLGIAGENLPNDGGALIQEVTAGGPASKAGLNVGDTIVGIDATVVHSMDDLITALNSYQPGQTVTLAFLRGGVRKTAKATLSARSTG